MATFTRRKNGCWQARIRRDGWPDESRTLSNRRDAEAWARARENEMDRGLYLPRTASERTTVGELADAWEKAVLPTKRAKTHFNAVLRSVREAFEKRAVATITSADVADWRDRRLTAVSPSSVRKEMFFLASLIDYGIADRGLVLQGNPARLAARPSEGKHRERRLVGDEEPRILAASAKIKQSDQCRALIILGLECGARLGELLALRWEEADLKTRVLTIRGVEVKGVRKLKNSESQRYSPLSLPALAALTALPRPIAGGRVFSAWERSDSFTKQWQRVCKAAGVLDLHFHDLRHEFASRMAPKVPMHVLMKLLGHKSPAMLARYYNQTADDVSRLANELYG